MFIEGKKYTSYIFTGKKETCSGCGACAQVCKKNAIVMQPDEEGFLYPVRDAEKCINCGLCDKRCPVVTNVSNSVESRQHCYVATTSLKKYYEESASIGICTMLADKIIKQGGVVYGCFLDEHDWSVYHKRVIDKKGVESIRNSKYIQSDTRNTFSEVLYDLKKGKRVFFVGTPCQVAGLKSFLNKDYVNLYTIDLFCHGVCSPKLLPLEIRYWEKKFNSRIQNFRFRSKRVYHHVNGGMVNFDIAKNGKLHHIERFAGSSPTYHCFAYSGDEYSYNIRLSCYSCPFRSSSRYADISVGDPWFVKDSVVETDALKSSNSVRSLFAVNTCKGQEFLAGIEGVLCQQEISFKDAFVQPAVCKTNRKIPIKREELFNKLNTSDYGKLVESLFDCRLDKEHFKFVVSYRINQIKKCIKSLLNIVKR